MVNVLNKNEVKDTIKRDDYTTKQYDVGILLEVKKIWGILTFLLSKLPIIN